MPRDRASRNRNPGCRLSQAGVRLAENVEYGDSARVLQHVWIAARSSLRMVFEQVSIQDLADGKLPQGVAALTEDDDAWQPH